MAKPQLFAVMYAPGVYHSGGYKTGAKVALYDGAGANRVLGKYKQRYPEVKKVPVAFGFTQEEAEDNCDSTLFLSCLESQGVDNWDGYEYAQDEYQEAKGDSDE